MDLTRETIDRIIQLARPETVEINGRQYSTGALHPVMEPVPAEIEVHSLGAVVGYLTDNLDKLDIVSGVMVHVAGPGIVRVISAASGPFKQRACYMEASPLIEPFPFGQFMEVESFIIGLSSKFQDTPDRETILKIVSTLRAGSTLVVDDDGISQKATVARGFFFWGVDVFVFG